MDHRHVTLRLTTKQPNSNRRGKDMYVSGLVNAANERTIWLQVFHHATGPWDKDSSREVAIERKRIRYASQPIPTNVAREGAQA